MHTDLNVSSSIDCSRGFAYFDCIALINITYSQFPVYLRDSLDLMAEEFFCFLLNIVAMFWFSLFFLIASSVIFANPIPVESSDLGNLSDTVPDGFNESDDTANDKVWDNREADIDSMKYSVIPTSSNVVVDSSVSPVADCLSDTSSTGSVDDKIEKRRTTVCPAQETPVRPGTRQPAKQPTTSNPRKPTNSDDLCTAELSYHVTCGGTEYMTSSLSRLPRPLIGIVPNCVPGKS